ncbi:MAG: SURF1 family protein [Alphaproteobacteria bacterium]|nr:SURF1 family protein [Alphaproteobacteria bacterium]
MPSRRSLFWPSVITLVGVVLTVVLGTWQVQRLTWKQGLIEARARAVAAPPIPVPERVTPEQEFVRTAVRGTFDHARELHLIGRAYRDRPGLHIITPLILEGGGVVLVNRGWVPNAARDPGQRAAGQSAEPVTVTGLIRLGSQRTWMQPENEPARNNWFYVDVAAMALATGYGDVRPFLIDADATPNPGGLPIGGQTRLDLPNNHLQYALTWYSFGLTLVVIYGIWVRRRLREQG